ncbi:MAG: ATP-binding protein [Acidobacteriota bacterium]|nr:ATP-binding protein [Acidobacteriota bacterium]
MYESRLERIGSAAAGIAHDLNNQLSLIVNNLTLPGEEGVNDARKAAERCSALTGSLLSYCRTGRIDVQSLDPAKLVRRFVSQLRLPEGVRLELDVPVSLPLIRANSMSVMRALVNLAGNACDAMNNQGRLRISAAAQQIEVSDSGPGIPHAVIRRMFEPFYSTKGGEGYGLGLAIVRETMREQGGYVAVNSEPGRGAHFILRFRAA